MVRKITVEKQQGILQDDLRKYMNLALELGATKSMVIETDQIVVDERVRGKCAFPRCRGYGTSANCPPHVMAVAEFRPIIAKFQHAILVRLEVPSEDIAGPEAAKRHAVRPYNRKMHEIVSKIEAAAFADGYYFATALGCGSCKIFCIDQDCAALIQGQSCRHPLKARPSMEALGIDVYTTVTRVGWDMYPIGKSTPPSDVPCGAVMGLILIK